MSNRRPDPTPSALSYRVDIEWPGGDEGHPSEPRTLNPLALNPQIGWPGLTRAPHNTAFLRLTVLSSSVLSRRGVALIDSYDEISIGRDRCATPRLRVKELAVSKYHANIYWDSQAKLWSIVDMGSTHGTNLVSPESPDARASGSVSNHGYCLSSSTRLSPPKTASLPKPLSHLQHVVIGGTTLVVHMHSDRLPCDACTIAENNVISLVTLGAGVGATANQTALKESEPTGAKSLKTLKRSLLSRPSYSVTPPATSMSYVDRAELRRQRFPGWRDADTRCDESLSQEKSSRKYQSQAYHDPRPTDAMPTQHLDTALPIPLTNVGHRLLAKQGWTPGSTLGFHSEDKAASNALAEPLVLQGTINRRGLGMK